MPVPAMLVGLGAKMLGVGKAVKGVAAKIPWQIWAVIGLVVALGVGSCVHDKKVKRFEKETYANGYAAGRASRDAEIKALQQRLATKTAPIVADVREKKDAEDRAISNRADALRLRGPGKATCASVASVSGGAGGQDGASRPANPAVAGVPSPEREYIALPFADTIAFGERCDKNRSEVIAWREWHNRIEALWKTEGQR